MKKTNKGFTIVELVVVIAVVAVLAAVLIPTFTSIIKKANDSAYLQERQNQRIEDLAEKIDNQNYLTWDDFEGKIAEAIADAMPAGDHLTAEEVKTAIQSAIDEYSASQANTRLTEEQVKKIVEKSLEGQVTMEQITALVNKAAAANPGVNVATVQSIVNQAIAGMSANPGLSAAQVSAMITSALQGQATSTEKTVAEAVAAALAQYAANNPSLTAEQVATIVEEALAAQTPAGPVGTGISTLTELQAAFANGGEYYLSADITVTAGMTATESVTIDFNNHTIYISEGAVKNNEDCMLSIKGTGKELTFNGNGSLVYAAPGGHTDAVIGGFGGASVVINGGTYVSVTDYLSGGVGVNLVINGGTFLGSLGTFADSTITVNVPCTLKVTNDGLPFTWLGNTVNCPDNLQCAITGTDDPETTITVTTK